MRVYTYTEARQNLASVLDQVAQDGEVRVKRRDGQVFVIRPEPSEKSPLEIDGIDLEISTKEIMDFIEEGRKSFD